MAVCRMVRYSYLYHFLVGFKCIFQLYISVSSILWYGYRYHMDIHTVWHCALLSCTPSPSIGLVFGCALSWCSVSLCVPYINSLVEWHFIIMFATIIGIFYGHFELHSRAFCDKVVLVLRTSMDVSAPGLSLWIVDLISCLLTILCHV